MNLFINQCYPNVYLEKKYFILINNLIFKAFRELYILYFIADFLSFIKQIVYKFDQLFFFISPDFNILIASNNGKFSNNIFILLLLQYFQ